MRHIRTRDIKARAEQFLEDYDYAMDEKFNLELRDFLKPMLADNDVITYDDIQGFLDSFEQPDENEWAFEQATSELDDIADFQMELERDRRMGL